MRVKQPSFAPRKLPNRPSNIRLQFWAEATRLNDALGACLRDVLTRLPAMTNWQIPEVTPEARGKAPKASRLKAAL